MMNEPVILVPLDGSAQALAAVPVAKVLSQIGHMSVRGLHVSDQKLGEAELRDCLAHGTPILDGLPLESRTGVPAAEILRAVHELNSRLVVMCRHSRPQRAELLGRTATDVIREASCPVVLVPSGARHWRVAPSARAGPARRHANHQCCPHSGDRPGKSGRGRAARGPRGAGQGYARGARGFTTPRYIDQPQHDWPSWSNEFAKRIASLCPLNHVRVRVSLARGEPAMEILRLSETQSTDLIVLAWRGRWDVPHAHILKKVLRSASCPVLILRTSETEPETANLELTSVRRPG